MKDKETCTCKVPYPRMKCSENGTFSYCEKCLKDYKK